MEKIKSFTDLIAWKKGHQLVIAVYKVTNEFPKKEMFALTNQICRCAVSITSNIAEGFSRKGIKEKIQFYYMSLGSVTELQNQLLIARDIGYLSKEGFNNLAKQTIEVSKLLNGLIKSLKKTVSN
ncbi:MAG: four helix bundle protein [Deltaproteobacteria bacterium]|nr:four helix bundle protein [Deltaproteobacteria bacterium]